jgi:hypothetical protein
MVELPPLPSTARFHFRFVDTIGFGSCDGCYRIGAVDHLCLHCCVSEGMTLGSCFVCSHDGPAWESCDWCRDGRFLPPGHGQCVECEYYGTVGEECHNCENGVFAPIPEEAELDSSNVLLAIIVEAEMAAVLESDSTISLPVASRTRSSDP